jgi:Uma2 family endonuclease
MLFSPTQQHPQQLQITVLTWVAGWYEEVMFQGEERLISATLPNLELTVAQLIRVVSE